MQIFGVCDCVYMLPVVLSIRNLQPCWIVGIYVVRLLADCTRKMLNRLISVILKVHGLCHKERSTECCYNSSDVNFIIKENAQRKNASRFPRFLGCWVRIQNVSLTNNLKISHQTKQKWNHFNCNVILKLDIFLPPVYKIRLLPLRWQPVYMNFYFNS